MLEGNRSQLRSVCVSEEKEVGGTGEDIWNCEEIDSVCEEEKVTDAEVEHVDVTGRGEGQT